MLAFVYLYRVKVFMTKTTSKNLCWLRSQRHKILLLKMQCALMQGSLLQQLPFLQKRLISSKKLLDLKLFEA